MEYRTACEAQAVFWMVGGDWDQRRQDKTGRAWISERFLGAATSRRVRKPDLSNIPSLAGVSHSDVALNGQFYQDIGIYERLRWEMDWHDIRLYPHA